MSDLPPPPPPNVRPPAPPGYAATYGDPSQPPLGPRGTNGMAIASLVVGIVWMCGIGSLLAVIFSRKAKKQISETGEQGDGLATAGFVLGVIGLASVVLWLVFIVAIQVLGQNASTSFSRTGNAINQLVVLGR